jgi:predicted acylesterase/phospholipase RssA
MRLATISRSIVLPILVACAVPSEGRLQGQTPQKRPKIGIAIYGGIGKASASSIGFLQALEENNIPVDMISGSGGASLVAALYATGHTPKEIQTAFEEYEGIFLESDFSSEYYASDYKIRRFLAQKFARFDLGAGATSAPPIPLLTLALDLSTGEIALPRLGFAEAVRVSFASPFYLEPVRIGNRVLIGEASGQIAALRNAGADIVIACFDPTFDFNKPYAQDQSGFKAFVTQSALDARDRDGILRDLQRADVVIPIPQGDFLQYDAVGSVSGVSKWGYTAFQTKARSLLPFAVATAEMAQKRDALSSYYKEPALTDRLTIDSVEIKGNRYLDSNAILKLLDLKTKSRFELDVILMSLDRLYATGYLSKCSFEFEHPRKDVVRIVLDVKESEFLPLESLPKLEAAIKVHKRTDVDNDEEEEDESDSKKSTAANASKDDADDEDDDDEDADSRFAAIAIGNLGPSAKRAIPKLAFLLLDTSPANQTAAVVALGAMGREAKAQLCNLVGFLTVEDPNLRREAAHAIARISAPLFSEQDLDALDSLESASGILDTDPRLAEYANSVHVSLSVLRNVQASVLANRADDYAVSEPEAGSLLSNSGEVLLNGFRVKLDVSEDQSHVRFLGGEAKTAIHQGINRLVKGKADFLFWTEERKLMAYQNPYRNSYAVVVAIDDYDRKKDPHYGGPTGYHALSGMVASAQSLTDVLTKLGFPKKNIITLYDEQATSASVQNVLTSFWPGGVNASADRLFFYFGGHGDKYSDNPADKGRTIPYLVTYDFDQKKPTQTALLMRDLADRDAQNILARHVLFALDACDSGLTLGGLGSPEAVDQRVRRFQALSLIRRDTENVARNLLVAGTGDQQALWQNGGLFTRALIEGLKGEADLNNDGVIQFEELGVYVRNRVTAQAAQTQVQQDPEFRVLDQYGSGRVLFIK